MFPVLEPAEIERVRRFGKVRSYRAGEALAKVGEMGLGLTIILGGNVEITQHDESGRRTAIVTHGPGAFMGELAQLAGRPALVDAYAKEPVEALIIPPDQLRALLIAEAELGERIMRTLILRRVGFGLRRSCHHMMAGGVIGDCYGPCKKSARHRFQPCRSRGW
jgi:thioredoxin reductase (NADPH)